MMFELGEGAGEAWRSELTSQNIQGNHGNLNSAVVAHRETTRYRVQKQMHGNYVIKVAFQISGERMFYSINIFETIALH